MKLFYKIAVFVLFLLSGNTIIKAQSKEKNNPFGKKSYKISDALDESRVLWSKVVWEFIDLANPENKNIRTIVDKNAKSKSETLFDILKDKAYRRNPDIFITADFSEKMTRKDLESKLKSIRKSGEYTDVFEIKSDDIFGYLVKGVWYFDKIESKTRYKIIGIAPMGPDIQTIGVQDIDDNNIYELFWAYYPAFENYFSNVLVSDAKNILRKVPLDYYLSNREFKAIEVDESSLNNNNSVFSDRKKNSFQLKKSSVNTDSILKQKEKSFWFKKEIVEKTKGRKSKRKKSKKSK